MKKKDIVIGIVVLAILAVILIFYNKSKTPSITQVPDLKEQESQIEEQFMVNIPENVEKASLQDVTGNGFIGFATRDFSNSMFTLTVLADLPDPDIGFYQAWLVKDDMYVSAGKLKVAKGGYLLEFNSSLDLSDYTKVQVTQETIFDSTPEVTILEGEF